MNTIYHDSSRAVLEISGADRFSFLQKLITQDLRLLETQTSIYSALLSPTGRYLFDFFVIQQDDSFLIISQNTEALLKKLLFYKLRSNIKITLLESKVLWSFEKETMLFQDPRHPTLGWWGVGEIEAKDTMEPYLDLRYQLAIPDSEDLEVEKSIILEWNFEKLKGISFEKGCYIGQELMSRTRYTGALRKKLVSINTSDLAYFSEDAEEKIGTIKKIYKNTALALIYIDKEYVLKTK